VADAAAAAVDEAPVARREVAGPEQRVPGGHAHEADRRPRLEVHARREAGEVRRGNGDVVCTRPRHAGPEAGGEHAVARVERVHVLARRLDDAGDV
jgi:hypothetical protein